MSESGTTFETPRFETFGPMQLAGIREYFTPETAHGIPELWRRFQETWMGKIPGRTGDADYGVSLRPSSGDAGFDYLVCEEVTDLLALSDELVTTSLPAVEYAIFPFNKHITQMGQTVGAILMEWIPESGYEIADTTDGVMVLERYTDDFNMETGAGVELWFPVKAKG